MNISKDKKIEFRVTEEEKTKIYELAKSAEIDVSSLIRNAVLSDEKLVLLPGGTEIAKGISKLVIEFSRSYKGSYIDSKYCPVLLTSIEELISSVNTLIERTTDICEDNEESQKEGIL